LANINNISLKDFRAFLIHKGLNKIRTTGGHETWSKSGLYRPIILQTHKDPIPLLVISTNLRTLGSTKKELIEFLS
jgi:hypothetical protein